MILQTLLMQAAVFIGSIISLNSYTEGILGTINTVNPLKISSDAEQTVSRLVFRSLFKYTKDGGIVGDLADTYQISDDGLEYRITLKKDIYWNDGKPITSDDVLYTASVSKNLREIATDRIDDKTVLFHLPNKYSPFLSVLTTPIANSSQASDPQDFYLVGSGDYRITKVVRGREGVSKIVLYTTNSDYHIKKLVFKFFKTAQDLKTAYKLGQIDGFLYSGKFDWPGVRVVKVPILGRYYVLHFNTEKDPFNDIDIRKAAFNAIDYNRLFNDVLGPVNKKAQGIISESEYTKDIEYFPEEPDMTKLSDEVTITLMVPDAQTPVAVAKYIRKQWAEIGINTDLKILPQSELVETISKERNYDALLMGEEVGRDPDRYVFFHSTQAQPPGNNFSSYSNLRVDKSLEKGRESLTFEDRAKHYNILQTVINEEAPAIFLYHPGFYYYINGRIDNAEIVDIFFPYERFSNFSDWKFRLEE